MTSSRPKPTLRLLTLGSPGHGRRSLARALATWYPPVEETTAPQEGGLYAGGELLVRHAHFETANRRYMQFYGSTLDELRQEMVLRAREDDGLLLVVSVIDGITSSLKEQLLLARQLGLSSPVAFLNKLDVTGAEDLADLCERELRELCSACGYPGDEVPVVRGSAALALEGGESPLGSRALEALLSSLDETIPVPIPEAEKDFLLSIEDSLSLPFRSRKGTVVVNGRVERGRVRVGDEVLLAGFGASHLLTVTAIEMFRRSLDYAEAGDNVSCCLLSAISRWEVRRGQLLLKPGSPVRWYESFAAKIYLLPFEESGLWDSLPSKAQVRLLFPQRNADVEGQIFPGETAALPASLGDASLLLGEPLLLERWLRFVLFYRELKVGFGVITSFFEAGLPGP